MLLAILVASACSGDDGTTAAETTPPRLPFPLPTDGTLPVDGFNAYTESIAEPWERDIAAVTDAFVEAGASDAPSRSFRTTSSGAGATATLQLDNLQDDSVQARRYDLTLSRRPDGTWRIDSAEWSQRCQQGRGHRTFSPALCL